MSRQRFSCRDREGHDERSGSRQELGLVKRFQVATENCCVGTEYLMSRQSFSQDQRVSRRDRAFLCYDRVGQARSFLSRQNVFMSQQSWPWWRGFLLHQSVVKWRGLVLRQSNSMS